MNKIVFFNHYHRGDLHTSKEFVRQVIKELPDDIIFEYQHDNPYELLDDLNLKSAPLLHTLDRKNPVVKIENTLYINTWVGSQWDIFCEHGGINMNTFYDQWSKLYAAINKFFDSNLMLHKNKEKYLPKIDWDSICQQSKNSIDKWLVPHDTKRKVLICNNNPISGQSFSSNMQEWIEPLAESNPDIQFILTDAIDKSIKNVSYTYTIVTTKNQTDLREISYLSTKCDVIIGKNSGPYVYCETFDNYMDNSKKFISYNTKNPQFDTIKETMSNGVKHRCEYTTVPIIDPNTLTVADKNMIEKSLSESLR